jgi:hypothetical protein
MRQKTAAMAPPVTFTAWYRFGGFAWTFVGTRQTERAARELVSRLPPEVEGCVTSGGRNPNRTRKHR